LGAIYEIGALSALTEALDGLDFNSADVYVGVSAGGFVAAGLVNGFTPHQMSRVFIEGEKTRDRFEPSVLLKPAYSEYAKRLASVPPLLASAAWHYVLGTSTAMSAFERLGRAIPTGVFSGEEVDRYLSGIFNQPDRSNDFRTLSRRLYLIATDLDTGESVNFGAPGLDHVPISRAVQATAALPGLFPPVEIDGRYFVDGALRKTLHASIALDEGIDLMVCLNPLVPYDSTPHHRTRDREHHLDKLVDGGLPVVLAQTFRSIIHSRLGAGMERYKTAYPDTDIVLFEPDHRDPEMYLANTFSYGQRRHLAEHAYQQTRRMLRSRRAGFSARFARHGITLNMDVLDDTRRQLVVPVKPSSRIGQAIASLQEVMDDLGDMVTPRARRHGTV